jgi:uncharacterized membrane protein
MEAFYLEWANLLLRWLHVVTAMAWIGASFYFVFLDSSLEKPQEPNPDRVAGELWAIHGGGFYHARKFMAAPPRVGGFLHWFYIESYFTWISGFLLFSVSYLWSPTAYLIDPSVADLSSGQAIAAALGLLLGFLVVYELICRYAGAPGKGDKAVAFFVAAAVAAGAWLSTELFSGPAAFLITGAMIATVMSANVLLWIIPGQRKMVASLQAGETVDPTPGLIGKQRSVHNTYFTLPVLLAMLSNHYSFLTSSDQRLLFLLGLMLAGALIRYYFVRMHGYKLGRHGHPWAFGLAGLVIVGCLIGYSAVAELEKRQLAQSAATSVSVAVLPLGASGPQGQGIAPIQQVMAQHCVQCHGAQVQMKNIRLDSLASIEQHASAVYQQVVVLRAMPLNNATQFTEAERNLVKTWYETRQ